ncbi:MAG: hypothetical protein J6U94_03970 [Paludibacteraceae bacterium]|nr:hypothetical protein [Paludibacteraceae bacterium]
MAFKRHKNTMVVIALMMVILVGMTACLGESSSDVEVSDDPRLLSFQFEKNDSVPHLEKAVFTIDQDNGLVYNTDSLPYQTRIDSVIPKFSFASTAASLLFVEDDTIYLGNKDTIDFTRQPMRLLNFAANGVDSKEYIITVNVHQVNPDLYVWEKMCDKISTREGSSQKLFRKEGMFCWLVSNGLRNYLYTSADAKVWTEVLINGLPNDVDFRQAQLFGEKLYVVCDGMLFVSENGQAWVAQTTSDVRFINLLFSFQNALWAMVKADDAKNYFACTVDGVNWVAETEMPTDFPVAEYAAVTFFSRTKTEKAMVMGGVSENGRTLNTRWCTENGKLWIDYSVEQPDFMNLTGAAVVQYGDKLLMFGGVDEENDGIGGQLFESMDEGLNWSVPDTLFNRYPEGYEPRNCPSVIVDEKHYIYLVGGKTKTRIYSDVWRTKLNEMDFVK